MSHSILRVSRVKGSSNSKGIQKHNQRENINYNNKDIKHEETYKNYDFINENNIDYKKVIDEKIDANYAGNRKIRADAIRHVDGLITSDNEFFSRLNEQETKQFFRDSLDFLEEEYGEENLLYATVHLDEKVPHMHFGFVPLTDDGRLSAKEKLGNKKAMTELQDRFNQFVNSRGYDLERGLSKEVTEKEHIDIDKFKKDTQYHEQEVARVKEELKELQGQFKTDLDRINSAGEFEFENELKGFLNKESTGRKIISAEEAERQQNTLASAERILDDYERVKNSDLYKDKESYRERNIKLVEGMTRLQNENSKLNSELTEEKKERGRLKDLVNGYQEFTRDLYKTLREHVNGFERTYNNFKDKFLENDKTYEIGRFMEVVQDNVHQTDRKREKRRTDDLEL